MKVRHIEVAGLLLGALALAACSRARIEAINLANEGDKVKAVDVEGAIGKYEQAVKLDPSNHRILYKLALAYKKKEDYDGAARTLSSATQLAPKFANYWFERGYALVKQAEKKTISWEETKEPFKKCIEADPHFSECYFHLGLAMLWTDNEQEALNYFTKAIEHGPGEIYYYPMLADLYVRLDYGKEAEQVIKEGLSQAKPDDKHRFGLHSLMASMLLDQDRKSDAVVELEAAKAVGGDEHPEILFSLGSTYAVLDPPRKTEAIQMLKGFSARACKSAKAVKYKEQCETTSALISKMGGTVQ